ncbi:MAG: cytochrome-c peroxidase [Gemmatimonadales bacterium]|nr:MAG: cytochrome-c peroxidase [Gemmatimonadales bacterium]
MNASKGRAVPFLGLAVAFLLGYFGPCQGSPAWQRSESGNPPYVEGKGKAAPLERIRLGARLFEDVRLSRDSSISCATCHMPSYAFAEPRPVSHGIGERARKRNTPTLINVAVFRSSFDWDGRAESLEEQLRGVFTVSGDMGLDLPEAVRRIAQDASYRRWFRRAYGRLPDAQSVLSALVEFLRSLVVTGSRFDRFYLGGDSTALSESEISGWRLFRSAKAGCAGCHVPLPDPGGSGVIVFTDNRFHNLGVGYKDGRMEDVGRYGVTRRPRDWGAFVTPSLNSVALTAPYMHDGSLETLEDVVEFYARGGIRNPNIDDVIAERKFSDQEKADLVAFLRALTVEWLSDSAEVRRRLLTFAPDSLGR